MNEDADVEFIKVIINIPKFDELLTDKTKQMIFDEMKATDSFIGEYFCRGRLSNCSILYLNQNILTADRHDVRENCILFIF